MTIGFEVKRHRASVTQGTATVYLNGQEVVTFGDRIELIKEGQAYYSDNIGGWASVTPDEDFIKGVLFHPLDHIYHYSDRVKEILSNKTKAAN